jgi:hypothetical protein
MTQSNDAPAAGYVDRCPWLPGTGGTPFSGWLICYGWGFAAGETTQVALGMEDGPVIAHPITGGGLN